MPAGQKYWIEEGSLTGCIKNVDLSGGGVSDHYCFTLVNKCLHAKHPLGWVRALKLKVDGEEVAQDKICFVLRGQRIPLKCMPTITDIWWNLAEEAQICVEKAGGLTPGPHTVECRLELSLHVNTRTVDREDIWPRLNTDLKAELNAV